MIVKEASYLSLEWRRLLQIADGTGAVEELPLELRGNSIPAHKHGRAQALQNLLFFLGKGSMVVVVLSPSLMMTSFAGSFLARASDVAIWQAVGRFPAESYSLPIPSFP